jgi:hypothetical protein
MRKTFAPLDDALIERVFQPASDLIAHRIGLSRANAACFCIDIASIGWIVSRAPGLSESVAAWDAWVAFLDVAMLMLGLVALICLRMLFRRAGPKQANPLRAIMRPHRAIVLLMLGARLAQLHSSGLAGAADLVMLLCATCALYLGACAEPPPVRRGWASLVPAS